MPKSSKVYVHGLPPTTTDEELDGLCGPHGRVKSARVVLLFDNMTRQKQGFGIIEMASAGDNQKIVGALHGSKLDESILRCFVLPGHINEIAQE